MTNPVALAEVFGPTMRFIEAAIEGRGAAKPWLVPSLQCAQDCLRDAILRDERPANEPWRDETAPLVRFETVLKALAEPTDAPERALSAAAIDAGQIAAAGGIEPEDLKRALWRVASEAGHVEAVGELTARALLVEAWAFGRELPVLEARS